jgi:hypothetical protein
MTMVIAHKDGFFELRFPYYDFKIYFIFYSSLNTNPGQDVTKLLLA